MLSVSQKYKNLVGDNVRPKCEPKIKVSGVDANGKNVEISWDASNITGLTYRRGIDVLGRELPYMELKWTEIHNGPFNVLAYPDKYNNIVKYMKVELSFTQNFEFAATWQSLKSYTWEDLKTKTWRDLKNLVSNEEIKMPTMFLSARPSINGNTIEWSAVDILSLLDENITKGFTDFYSVDSNGKTSVSSSISFVNPIIYILLNARSVFSKSQEAFNLITNNADELDGKYPTLKLEKPIIFNSSAKECLRNYASIKNLYWDFFNSGSSYNGGLELKEFKVGNSVYTFDSNVISDYPKITLGTDITAYNFKNYEVVKNNNPYVVNGKEYFGTNQYTVYEYKFDNLGELKIEDISVINEINRAFVVQTTGASGGPTASVNPINYNGFDNSIYNENTKGESYNEDNPVNPYSSKDNASRANYLKSYFNKDSCSLEFEGLPHLGLEPGDVCSISTNLFSDGKRIEKTAVIVSFELSYNGALKQKFIAHEVAV